jgi:hypothetical protein
MIKKKNKTHENPSQLPGNPVELSPQASLKPDRLIE